MNSLVKSVVHWGAQQRSASPVDLCENCGKKPKFVERGFQHPYCGRTCARSGGGQASNPNACALRGCRAVGKSSFGGFCSEAHGRDAVRSGQAKACDQCRVHAQIAGNLCGACDRRAQSTPRLGELDNNGATFRSIANNWARQWNDARTRPNIERVFEVTMPRDRQAKRKAYLKKLDQAGGYFEQQTFHSSQCICDLGVKNPLLCDWKSCGICNIVKSSFQSFAFGVPQNSGRYGAGIYSYQNPALADRFATSSTSSPYRAIIACDVAMTNGKSDSVNDGERVFVTNPDAIIPSYIILYK
ncbi:hypothetical protein JAAARDRAFT_40055 [Jaapia argillacea MUCL 33604]|uniref:PARP catalytic domain-containing protein n=1 Tax=Jaapia argillacea MUCL 33604 TaxID=933084 RepID=A0A067PFZ7_9AGAM|nr:hypothetical protein JAAARDRAFT_40055 [Jaapia argillacea MUCL 33604]